MDNGLERNDPYRNMETGSKGVRPDFLSTTDKNREAAERLNDIENNASATVANPGDGADGANKAEKSAEGFYTGSGKGDDSSNTSNKKKTLLKRGGPIFAIILSVFGIGGTMLGTQMFQPFSLVAQFEETFNSMHTSADVRSAVFFKKQMETGRVKRPIKGNKIFGYKFTISEKQKQKLAQQGIEFDENYNGKKVLKYTSADGELKIVTADNFQTVYHNDVEFFKKYNAGSMTWRGAIANWFGTNTSTFLKNNKLTRNMFEKYKERVESAEQGKTRLDVAKETIEEKTKILNEDMKMKIGETGMDDDGSETVGGREESVGRNVTSRAEAVAKINDIAAKYNTAANVACGAMGFIGAVSLLVSANEALQIINLTTAYFEAVDKTKAGYGDETPINELSNTLNERKQNTNVMIEGEGNKEVSDNGIGGMKTVSVTTEKTAMESAGVAALYSGGIVNPRDPSVQSFNLTSSMKRIMGGIGVSTSAFEGCLIAKMGTAALSALADGMEIGTCVLGILGAIPTAGISLAGCGPLAASIGLQIAAGLALGAVLSGIVALITPVVTNMLTRNLVAELGGENLGNALTSGANMYQGGTHRANGGSLATIDKYENFAMARKQIIAEKAKNERESLSPFDITSKYTFMGTLLTSMMSFSHANTLASTFSAGGAALSSSLLALSPSATAYDIAADLPDNIEDYWDTCPYLASIDAIGDSYCNPYTISDLDTINDDPEDVIEAVDGYGGLGEDSSDGNVTVDPDSELAKYIRYCSERGSSFGVADQNIASEVGDFGQTSSAAANGAIGSIPVIGDAIEIISDASQLRNIGYISGESCVAGNNVNAASSPNWKEAKYYQRFIEDQSLAESMGLIEKSAVTAYLEDYYEKNPLDNSYEGILARYSGLNKETVVAILDVLDYENYIANYDPTERYAFGGVKNEDIEEEMNYNNENVLGGEGILLGNIVYADVRNRSFAI